MTHFAHDRIVHLGGAEAVLADLIRQYGDDNSRIFVMYSDKEFFEVDGKQYPIVTALPNMINKLFSPDKTEGLKSFRSQWRSRMGLHRLFDYRNLMPWYPRLCWILRRKLVAKSQQPTATYLIISSFAAVKNIIPTTGYWLLASSYQPIVTLYLHSPMQYIRENYSEYTKKLRGIKKWIFVLVAKYLRPRDQAARYYDHIIYNSHYTKSIAEKLYHFSSQKPVASSQIQYPAIHPFFLSEPVAKSSETLDYFVFVGRLVTFIRETDIIIKLANALHFPLLVLGDGPDTDELKTLAGPTVTFLGNISDIKTKIEIIKKSRGLINLAKESAGLGTMEALSLGVPVFGYNAGGTKELVKEGMGLLVDDKSMENLIEKFKIFQQTTFNKESIKHLFTNL